LLTPEIPVSLGHRVMACGRSRRTPGMNHDAIIDRIDQRSTPSGAAMDQVFLGRQCVNHLSEHLHKEIVRN
jgi:hypothetical protein